MSLLIHPGFHKTGTTWLQQQLFSDTGYFHSMFSHEEIYSLFVRPHDLEFCRDTAEKLVSERRSNDTNGGGKPIVDVISSEILSGLIFTGSHTSKIIAERLAECCGGAKILFTVRAQKPITRSIYFQYIKRGGRLDIEDFLTYRPEPGYGWFNPSVVAFDLLVRCYADLFGADNVLVLPQELLGRGDRLPARIGRRDLTGLDPADAVRFFSEWGIQATPAEVKAVCEPLEYHPFCMALLAGTATFSIASWKVKQSSGV